MVFLTHFLSLLLFSVQFVWALNPAYVAWRSNYEEIDASQTISRPWKPDTAVKTGGEILDSLPSHLHPILPEGYIWSKEEAGYNILKHKEAPSQKLNIYVFAEDPDLKKKGRIQYLVTVDEVPIHGFAMTNRAGFVNSLRDDYPMPLNAYKKKDEVYWRGHIIDYKDTLGNASDSNLSTLMKCNYKPEPAGTWARTLRKDWVAKIRDNEGSYGEIMLYDWSCSKTADQTPIPRGVICNEFNYGTDRIGGVFVSFDTGPDTCHVWKKAPKEKGFVNKCLRNLKCDEAFPPILIAANDNDGESVKGFKMTLPEDLKNLSPKEAFKLKRGAEVEFDSPVLQVGYATYCAHHGAPEREVNYWLSRALKTIQDSKCTVCLPLSLHQELTKALKNPSQEIQDKLDQLKEYALETQPASTSSKYQTPIKHSKDEGEEIISVTPGTSKD